MLKVFRFIKKKRNLRRLSAVWLCLVIAELFCPVFCDEPAFAANLNSQQPTVNRSIKEIGNNSQASVSNCEHQNSEHQQTNCSDECLCHATAALNINVLNLKDSFIVREKIDFSYSDPLFNSLPPPYQPPKNS